MSVTDKADLHNASAAHKAEWPPIPTLEEQLCVAEHPFPVDVFPDRLAEFVCEGASALHCPAAYLASAMLAVAGTAIGSKRCIQIKNGWVEKPALWVVIIGLPGVSKTPVLKMALQPLTDLNKLLYDAYCKEKKAWENATERGDKPIRKQLKVNNVTNEKLAEILRDNSHGVVQFRDEGAAWLKSMDQYRPGGKGGDREFYSEAFSGVDAEYQRKGAADSVFVHDPCLSLLIGLQPARLPELCPKNIDDGFLDRCLVVYPEPCPAVGEDWAEISVDATLTWRETVEHLIAMPPKTLYLTHRGQETWQKITTSHAAEINAESFPVSLRGPWAKFKTYLPRLALIMQHLYLLHEDGYNEDVDDVALDAAQQLVDYFKSQIRKVHGELGTNHPDVAAANKLATWLREGKHLTFTQRDAQRLLSGTHPTVAKLKPVLGLLCKLHCIRKQAQTNDKGPGRPPELTKSTLASGVKVNCLKVL